MVKLDKKDRLLLLSLDRDSRRSYSSLSKRLSIPIETIRYRTKRLLDSGVIASLSPIIDEGRLGYYNYRVFLRLQNSEEKQVRHLLGELSGNSDISWATRVDGNYDIGFTARAKTPADQSSLIDRLRWKHSEQIRRWTISTNIRTDVFARDYLTGSKHRAGAKGHSVSGGSVVELDEPGKLVLKAVSKKPRAKVTELSKELELSQDVISERIKRLEKDRVIVRYSLTTNTKLMGHVHVYVLVRLENVDPEAEKCFVNYCSQQSNIVSLTKSLGDWDYELSVEAESMQDYRDLMMRLNTEFSEHIQEYNGLTVSQTL